VVARNAYERVINSEHPDERPKAWLNLGVLLRDEGDAAGAANAYLRALDLYLPNQRWHAWDTLQALLADHAVSRRARPCPTR
jgi:tetratricopeptide (TPR) repeat protein